ncbi:MAG: hypothetical protein FD167_3567 [bacterium]|nr:MAG: hypothetical protein FD167_3567 [bacterium]
MDWKTLLKKIKFPQRKYLRPNPPPKTEKILGYIILILVIVIGGAVYRSGRHYNPNLFRLDPELLKNAKEKEGVQVAGGERRGNRNNSLDGEPTGQLEGASYEAGSSPSNTPSSTNNANAGSKEGEQFIPAEIAGLAWKRKPEIEKFTTENLYDKVDGRENLYKSFEFQLLLAADYNFNTDPSRFIQVELYDMTSPKSALGVFSSERPSHPNAAKIGNDAYTETNGAFFWKGQYYVRVIGSDNEKSTEEAATKIAKTIAEKLPESKDTAAIENPLPKENQVPNSFSIIPDSAFGQAFLRNVYSARYKIDNIELTGFLMTNDSADKAKSIVKQYQESMASFGKFNLVTSDPAEIYHLEAFGSHYVIFSKGNTVGGVMEADKKDPAIKLIKQLAVSTK